MIAQGGIPKKNEFVMQVTSMSNMPPKVVNSIKQGAGAAMCAATAKKMYHDLREAQSMGSGYSGSIRRRRVPNL